MTSQFSDTAIKTLQSTTPVTGPSASTTTADEKDAKSGAPRLKWLQDTYQELADTSRMHGRVYHLWRDTQKKHKSLVAQLDHSIKSLSAPPSLKQVEAIIEQYKLPQLDMSALRLAVKLAQHSTLADAKESKKATIDLGVGRQKLLDFTAPAFVKAAMWNPASNEWILGVNAHGEGLDTSRVPEAIRAKIKSQPKDNSAYAFGTNCAEVHCVIKAYNKKKRTAEDLKGCVFVAHMGSDGFVGPCLSCKGWITACRGNFIMPMR